ncbi:MAG: type III secretion protein [Deltaproteobacteria bacterium]|nr:type III secretion protein [Deltaproteobacteria bacterium]
MRIRAAFAVLPVLWLAGCSVEIQHELTESEANDIVVLLERNRISAKKEKEEGGREVTWKIAVPKAHMATAMLVLKENELPRPKTKGLEMFDRGSLIPTATEERAMYLKAITGELSRTLSSIDGVLDARVHINIPQIDDLADRSARPEPSAGVLMKFRANAEQGKKAPPPPIAEEQIQQLVARTIQDLKPQNVSVIMTTAAPPQVLDSSPGDVELLGIRMAASSVRTFQAILATLVLIILALAAYIVFSKTREMRGPARVPRTRTGAS